MASSILHVTGNNWNLSHTAIAGMRFFVRISNKSRKSCFLMRPIWASAVLAILCFFWVSLSESSQSTLCSDPRDRSTGMAVYDAGIASEDYGGCVLMKRQRARCANIQGLKKNKVHSWVALAWWVLSSLCCDSYESYLSYMSLVNPINLIWVYTVCTSLMSFTWGLRDLWVLAVCVSLYI